MRKVEKKKRKLVKMEKLKGIDLSHHNGDINFNSVKNGGIQFVILRDGFGTTTEDRKFREYVEGCKNAGLKILGLYHFSYALNESQARKEAEICIRRAKSECLGVDTQIYFDLEYDSVNYARQNGVIIDKAKCESFTNAFCERVQALGYKAGIYLNRSYYKNMYSSSTLQKYNIWLADYKETPTYSCLLHQYTSSGKVSGITGNVDCDFYYGEISSASSESGEWKENEKGWWWSVDGAYITNDWKKINGFWYYFNNEGYAVTGWQFINQDWYYFNEKCQLLKGWQLINNKWYYLAEDTGAMLKGWIKYKDNWYFLDEKNGNMVSDEFKKVNGAWYKFDDAGHMLTDTKLTVEPNGIIR